MDSELNLRLLGMMHQISYLMQTQEKFRGQGRLLVLLNQYGALTQRELIELTGRRSRMTRSSRISYSTSSWTAWRSPG